MTEQIHELMGKNDWNGAMALTQAKLLDCPSSSKLHALLGLCHYRNQRFEDAAKAFRIALTLDNKNFEAALKLAQCLDRLLRYPEALEAAKCAHKLKPGDATVNVLINGLSRQVTPANTDAWQRTQVLQQNVSFSQD